MGVIFWDLIIQEVDLGLNINSGSRVRKAKQSISALINVAQVFHFEIINLLYY